jgi:hypothetical protein
MATDFLTLLRRDHHDLACGLSELLDATSLAEIRSALDGVRLGLTAHAEAEDIVLYHALSRCPASAGLEPVVGEARAAHVSQERALGALVGTSPYTAAWRDRAHHLRELVVQHATWEEHHVVARLREVAPAIYDGLAGAFATERLRQLAMLAPSGVFEPAVVSSPRGVSLDAE